jgi:transcriptional regulator with XRE-family HTH domain
MFEGYFVSGGTMTAYDRTNASTMVEAHPVFRGLQEATVSTRDIASMLGVAPSMVSKWRKGQAKVPHAKLAFLTLILANWLDEIEDEERSPGGHGGSAMELRLEAARRALRLQEVRNTSLPPGALSKGAEKFHAWWDARIDHRDDARSPWDLASVLVT